METKVLWGGTGSLAESEIDKKYFGAQDFMFDLQRFSVSVSGYTQLHLFEGKNAALLVMNDLNTTKVYGSMPSGDGDVTWSATENSDIWFEKTAVGYYKYTLHADIGDGDKNNTFIIYAPGNTSAYELVLEGKNLKLTTYNGDVVNVKTYSAVVSVDSNGELTLKAGEFMTDSVAEGNTLTLGISAQYETDVVKVDDVTFSNGTSGTYTKTSGGVTATLSSTDSTASLTAAAGIDLVVGGVTYRTKAAGTQIFYSAQNLGKLTAGAVTLAKDEAIEVAGKGIVTNTGTANITVDKDGKITWTATDGVSFTTKDDANDANLHTYKVKNGNLFVYNANSTDLKIYSAWDSVTMATNEQDYWGEVVNGTPATGGDINVAPTASTTAGDHYFNTDGIELPDGTGAAIKIWYADDGANAQTHVESPLTVKVNLTGAGIRFSDDGNKYATYTINGSDFKGSSFSTSVEGEKTLISGEVTALTGNGTYDLGARPVNSLTFAGKGKTDATLPTGATINLVMGDGKYVPVVVTEASADADVNDTVIRGNGVVRGLDTGAAVTANNITATAGADNLSLVATDNGLGTSFFDETKSWEVIKIAFTTESGGSFTFTSATSATNLKGVTAAMSEGSTVVGARGESESVTALSETGGEVKALCQRRPYHHQSRTIYCLGKW